MTPVSDAPTLVDPPRTRGLVWILGALAALGPLTVDLYLPSFPAIAESLGTSVAAVQLTLATYLAGLAIGQLLYGPISDGRGRRAPLLAGLGLYVAASLACAAAPSLPLLVAGRFLQAVGGCAGIVISRAVVRDHFDARGSAKLYSSLILIMGVAPILAPVLGSQLLLVAGWRAIFLVLAAAGAALLLIIGYNLPESLPRAARTRRSVGGTLLGMGALMREGRFMRLAVAGGSVQAAMFTYIAGSPFVFIELFGVSERSYGLLFGANAAGLILASQVNRWLVPRFGVVRALRGGVWLVLASSGALLASVLAGGDLTSILVPLWVTLACVGVVLPNGTAAAMAPYGREAGLASALLGTLQIGCGALAAALVSGLADGTAVPMAAVMTGCAALAALLLLGVRERA